MNKNQKNIKESYDSLIEVVSNWLFDEDIKKQFEHLNKEKVQMVIYKAATYGWYIDDFSVNSEIKINNCLKLIYANLPDKLNLYFSNYYNKKLTKIQENLSKKYTLRSEIINEAFYAHKSGLFHSSICLFITLIDGICNDKMDSKFFINKKFLPEIKYKLENKEIKYSDFLLSPINKKATINGWEKELHNFPVRLNRHEIIHGVDVNYGNELNSLKLISTLSYIDFIVSHFNK
ncbi:hypothetical protein [Mesonia sp. K4-1]|uniref:hypothetical protein n=1 Tax=Mesonia sp. K4-1 TaxID=2602760 RepID=UPI0011CA4BFB|nr:hypothetical protein [Mesonia sp. K4-1]TXK71904.1 hypothetical protein FT986_15675 [Mesonia sp. K4-1]